MVGRQIRNILPRDSLRRPSLGGFLWKMHLVEGSHIFVFVYCLLFIVYLYVYICVYLCMYVCIVVCVFSAFIVCLIVYIVNVHLCVC